MAATDTGTIAAGPCSLGADCRAKDKTRQSRYKCRRCHDGLHAMFCTMAAGEDGKIECPEGLGCKMAKTPALRAPPLRAPRKKRSPATASVPPTMSRTKPRTKPAPKKKTPVPATKWGLQKRGPKPGSKKTERTRDFWYNLCVLFKGAHSKLTHRAFLESSHSGGEVTGTQSEINGFGKHLKQYATGALKPSQNKRNRGSLYPDLEAKLVAYVRLRQRLYKKDKVGLSWTYMQEKLKLWAKAENDDKYKYFQASPGFLNRCLKRNGIVGFSLHGEANEISDEDRVRVINVCRDEIKETIVRYGVAVGCVYNADQTGLFYNKLPNRMYADKVRRKTLKGAKQMKSKDRVTLMVAIGADGGKVPLYVVGRSKKPLCFSLCDNKPPIPYTNQANAWFDKKVFLDWVNKVFWPHHLKTKGDVHLILILDNFSGQKNIELLLPEKLHVIYLPPNVTSHHQPADMGIIACLKVGYRTCFLSTLLSIFEEEGGFERAANLRSQQPRGCKGLAYGGKATVLDTMRILKSLWDENTKYASEDSIRRCWRKADILPASWNADINNDVGSGSLSNKSKRISTELCTELCGLMGRLSVKAMATNVNCATTGYALSDSFVSEEVSDLEELQEMADAWIDIEDRAIILEVEVDETIEELERTTASAAANSQEEEEEGDDDPLMEEACAGRFDSTIIPSFLEAEEMVSKLMAYARSKGSGMDKDDLHLVERFGQRVRNIRVSRPSSQAVLTNFFPHSTDKSRDINLSDDDSMVE